MEDGDEGVNPVKVQLIPVPLLYQSRCGLEEHCMEKHGGSPGTSQDGLYIQIGTGQGGQHVPRHSHIVWLCQQELLWIGYACDRVGGWHYARGFSHLDFSITKGVSWRIEGLGQLPVAVRKQDRRAPVATLVEIEVATKVGVAIAAGNGVSVGILGISIAVVHRADSDH